MASSDFCRIGWPESVKQERATADIGNSTLISGNQSHEAQTP
jgi:hypothetical protein